jgi:hypothetical protein
MFQCLRRSLCLCFLILCFCLDGPGISPAGAQESSPVGKPQRGLDSLPGFAHSEPGSGKVLPGQQSSARQASGGSWANLVFQSYRDGNWEIYLTHDFGQTATRLTFDALSDQEPRLNSQATQVVFSKGDDQSSKIFKMNLDGSGLARLSNSTNLKEVAPAWSPDGRKVAYASVKGGRGSTYDIYIVPADDPTAYPAQIDSGGNDLYPTWSPDGTKLAWVQAGADGLGKLLIINADLSGMQTIVSGMRFLQSPVWSPDGRLIAFDADLDGDGWNELGVIQPDGQNLQTVYDYGYGPTVDLWMGSWFRGSSALLYSMLEYTSYYGSWKLEYVRIGCVPLNQYEGNLSCLSFFEDRSSALPDFISTDRTAPAVEFIEPPVYSHADGETLAWIERDAGGSGIANVEVHEVEAHSSDWKLVFSGLSPSHSIQIRGYPGRESKFRVRGIDAAGNEGTWSAIEPRTKFYQWGIYGRVLDNRGIGLPGAEVVYERGYPNPQKTSLSGDYQVYVNNTGHYLIGANYPGYRNFSQWLDISSDRNFHPRLTPLDDGMVNGDFQLVDVQPPGWITSPADPLKIVQTDREQYVVQFGALCPFQPCLGEPELIPSSNENQGDMVVDSQGRPHLLLGAGAFKRLSYIYRSQDGNWAEPTLLQSEESTGPYPEAVRLAIDEGDNLYAAWSGSAATGPEVFFSQRMAGGVWTAPQKLANGIVYSIEADSRGGLHLAYESKDGGFYYLERLPSGIWNSPVLVNQSGDSICDLAVGPDNALHFVYYEQTNHRWGVMYRVRRPEGSWSEQEEVPILEKGLSILVDRANTLHIFGDGQYASRKPGEDWSQRVNVTPGGQEVSMGVDSQGTIYLVYPDRYNYSRFFRVKQNGVWSQPVLLSEDSYLLSTLAVAPDGRFHIIEGSFYQNESYFLRYYTERPPAQNSQPSISQSVFVPDTLHRPTLAFWYTLSPGPENSTSVFSATITGANGTPVDVFSTKTGTGWRQAWIDMTPWVGQSITLSFTLYQVKDEPYRLVYLDDISLGSWRTPVITQVSTSRFLEGWAGRVVTISGQNLLPEITAEIGATPAAVEWVSDTELRLTLPAGLLPGRHDLWLFNPGGQAAALPAGFSFGHFLFLPVMEK